MLEAHMFLIILDEKITSLMRMQVNQANLIAYCLLQQMIYYNWCFKESLALKFFGEIVSEGQLS